MIRPGWIGLAVAAAILWVQNGWALQLGEQAVDVSGYLESRHCLQTQSPNEFLASETLLRPEIRSSKDGFELFASADISENHVNADESGIELHEAYVDYIASVWDLRLGRQIITWGNADGVRITDNICPSDYSEYITRDFDEIRVAVDALKLRWFSKYGSAELIYIPFFEAGILPGPDSPWAVGGMGEDISIDGSDEPEKELENGEIAVKYAFFFPGWDCAFSYFYTWNDFPVYAFTEIPGPGMSAAATYERRHIYGLELSLPYRNFVIRGETAYTRDGLYQPRMAARPLQKKDSIQWLLGLDWYPGNQWTLLCQLVDERIRDHSAALCAAAHSTIATFNLSRDLFREKLTLSVMLYYDLDIHDSLARLSADYKPVDGCTLSFGADIFSGDREGDFGQYKDNTQVWTKLKYYF